MMAHVITRYASSAATLTDSSASERERPQDVAELVFGQPVQVRHHAIQFGALENTAE